MSLKNKRKWLRETKKDENNKNEMSKMVSISCLF